MAFNLIGMPPAPRSLSAGASPAFPSGGANESEVIAGFLCGAGLRAAEVSGDIETMADSLANSLGGGPPPNGGSGTHH